MNKAIRKFLLGVVTTLGLTVSAGAQTSISQSVDRAQLLRNQPPTLREGSTGTGDSAESVPSPNDPDLGEQAILKRSDNYKPFSIIVSAPISYTSNVALASAGEKSDVLFTPNFLVAFAPRITKTLYGNISIGQQMFYYDRFSQLNFGSFDARAGLTYTVPEFHNLVFRADYAFNRLTTDDFTEFFTSHTLNFGAEMPFALGRAQQVSVGADLGLDLASEPSAPGRNDYSFFVSYTANLARSFAVNAVFRLAVRDYTDIDRLDVSEIFALSASYRFTNYLTLSAIATYARNDSSRDVFSYDVANGGGALTLNFRF